MPHEEGIELQRAGEHAPDSDRVCLCLAAHPFSRPRRAIAAILARTDLGLREKVAARELERGMVRERRRHDVERRDVDARGVPRRADAVE